MTRITSSRSVYGRAETSGATPPAPLRRVLLYGVTGSGKSTAAERIAAVTGLPWHSVDDLAFGAGWVQVPEAEQRRRFEAICAGERWVLDTAYASWRDVALARADLVVALDYPRHVSLGRLLRRTLRRVVTGEPVCNGNRETWRQVLSRDSILVWHLRSFRRKHETIRALAAAGSPPVVVVTRPAALEQWIGALPAPAHPPDADGSRGSRGSRGPTTS